MRALRLLIGLSIVLSSSRLGVGFVLLDVAWRSASRCWPFVRDPVKFLFDPIKPWKIVRAAAISSFLIGIVFTAVGLIKQHVAAATLLLAGTGLYGATAHSVLEREKSFLDTLTIFRQHPLIGRSLGGVSSAIAELHGEQIHSFEDTKPYEGMATLAEVLAASGILGLFPFVVFFAVTIYKPLKLAKSSVLEDSILLRALVHALVFEWLILQFNQNVLRPYLWVHLAVLATVYASVRRSVPGGAAPVLKRLPESPG